MSRYCTTTSWEKQQIKLNHINKISRAIAHNFRLLVSVLNTITVIKYLSPFLCSGKTFIFLIAIDGYQKLFKQHSPQFCAISANMDTHQLPLHKSNTWNEMLRKMVNKARKDQVWNEITQEMMGITPVQNYTENQRINWFRHFICTNPLQSAACAYNSKTSVYWTDRVKQWGNITCLQPGPLTLLWTSVDQCLKLPVTLTAKEDRFWMWNISIQTGNKYAVIF